MRLGWIFSMVLLLVTGGCTTLRQTPDQIYVRDAGCRLLQGPRPTAPQAAWDWPFARLSQTAYAARSNLPDPAAGILTTAGWRRWENFPSDALLRQIEESNLRVEVWDRRDPAMVVVAFGGTVFTNARDWLANLRWFIPWHDDEYTKVVREVGPAFVQEFARRARLPENAHFSSATILSTGHSLGGGLAQQFAYALPITPAGPRVSKVLAFDPSPVTGFYSVDKATRDHNKIGLSIERTYERGEVLAFLRAAVSVIYPPTSVDPAIWGVRYSLFDAVNPISGHSIVELADKLQIFAGAPRAAEAPQGTPCVSIPKPDR